MMLNWFEEDPERNIAPRCFGPSLCNYCNELFSTLESHPPDPVTSYKAWPYGYGYHPTVSSLYNAVRSGCQHCIRLEYQLQQIYGYSDAEGPCSSKDLNSDWVEPVLQFKADWDTPHIIKIFLASKQKILAWVIGAPDSYFAYPGTSRRERVRTELAGYPNLNYTPPDSTDSLSLWKLCRSWMENCIKNHEKCKSLHHGETRWPTRLLYIGNLSDEDISSRDPNSPRIELHLMKGKQPEGFYMTLSHCWGDPEKMLKLTMEDYEHRKENGFSHAELPKTFQDAIRLCRFLRSDYLWIDSLCIIQDSEEDWMQESQSMANVYLYSRCNIAATASRAPTEGCFYRRDPAVVSPLEIKFNERHSGKIPSVRRYLFLDNRIWKRSVENAPLNKRAWVMQERALATRQIHCGRDQISWECNQTTASETFPFIFEFGNEFYQETTGERDVPRYGNYDPAITTPLTPSLNLGFTLSEMSRLRSSTIIHDRFLSSAACCSGIDMPNSDNALSHPVGADQEEMIAHLRHKIYQDWTNIVDRYSSCALSHRTDKLVAILGIASRIQDVLKGMDTYVAGLWRSQLPWQLLWTVPYGVEYKSHSYDIGPSWSWASLNTRVQFYCPEKDWAHTYKIVINIAEVHDGHTITERGTADRLSPLTLRCLVYKIHISREEAFVELGGSKGYMDRSILSEYLRNSGYCNRMDQVYLVPVMYNEEGFQGLVVSPCQDQSQGQENPRSRFYRRLMRWADSSKIGSEPSVNFAIMLIKHVGMATDMDKETITLI
ncbi:heterokaryon incompatibility protein-domain-containing protein, partial [Jackrogersella minutella]